MDYSIVNKQWYADNEQEVLALFTIPNWEPTDHGEFYGLRSVDVSGIAGAEVLILPVREVVGADEDRYETDEEYRLRIAGVANSALVRVKAAGSIDAVVYYSEYDIRVLRGLDDWPINQEPV